MAIDELSYLAEVDGKTPRAALAFEAGRLLNYLRFALIRVWLAPNHVARKSATAVARQLISRAYALLGSPRARDAFEARVMRELGRVRDLSSEEFHVEALLQLDSELREPNVEPGAPLDRDAEMRSTIDFFVREIREAVAGFAQSRERGLSMHELAAFRLGRQVDRGIRSRRPQRHFVRKVEEKTKHGVRAYYRLRGQPTSAALAERHWFDRVKNRLLALDLLTSELRGRLANLRTCEAEFREAGVQALSAVIRTALDGRGSPDEQSSGLPDASSDGTPAAQSNVPAVSGRDVATVPCKGLSANPSTDAASGGYLGIRLIEEGHRVAREKHPEPVRVAGPKPWKVLQVLVASKGNPCAPEVLERIWCATGPEGNSNRRAIMHSLQQTISRLRANLKGIGLAITEARGDVDYRLVDS